MLILLSFVGTLLAAPCGPDLVPPDPVRLFPWPLPTAEMIAALADFAAAGDYPGLTAALAERAPDRVIARMFHPATLADVRALYGPPGHPLPANHALAVDAQGLRSLLSRTLVTIADPDRRVEWMEYMADDASLSVRINVARSYLSSLDPPARDRFVDRALRSSADRAPILAALSLPEALSPRARWAVIEACVEPNRTDAAILRAIDTYPQKKMLRAWYQDSIADTGLSRALNTYDPSWRWQLRRVGPKNFSRHAQSARFQGLTLANLYNDVLRAQWIEEFERAAADFTAPSEYARDVLAHARAHLAGEDAGLRATWAWTDQQMKEFVSNLEPAN